MRRFDSHREARLTAVIAIAYPPTVLLDAALLFTTKSIGLPSPYRAIGGWAYILPLYVMVIALHYWCLAAPMRFRKLKEQSAVAHYRGTKSYRVAYFSFLLSPLVAHYCQYLVLH